MNFSFLWVFGYGGGNYYAPVVVASKELGLCRVVTRGWGLGLGFGTGVGVGWVLITDQLNNKVFFWSSLQPFSGGFLENRHSLAVQMYVQY